MTTAQPHDSVVIRTNGEPDTAKLGATIGELGAPLVLALVGPLGAGKTALVRGLVHALKDGAPLRVQSPTFALARTYPTTPPVHHLDLYRLDDEGTCVELGLDEMVQDREAISCVEWADQAIGILDGTRTLRLDFPQTAEEQREIVVTGDEDALSFIRARMNA